MSIIEINHLTKEYQLGQLQSVKETALNTMNRLRGREVVKKERFKALDDINLRIEPGEVVGIIGTNGAGKSTLLKIISGISVPTMGEVNVGGTIAPLIEVGTGLHPELTGRENIFLNGSILGIPRGKIKKKIDEIVEFAELEQFIDTPVKRYSSGMRIRLGFSIATSVDADILIVDEVLAVGDLAFQRKCFDRIEKLIKSSDKAVLIVSHNIRQIQRLCSRVILIDKGKISLDGEPPSVCGQFYENSNKKIKENKEREGRGILKFSSSGEIDFIEVQTFNDEESFQSDTVDFLGSMKVVVHFKSNVFLKYPDLILGFHTTDFFYISTMTSAALSKKFEISPGVYSAEFYIHSLPLNPGVYCLRVGFVDQYHRTIWHGENLKTFMVSSEKVNVSKESLLGVLHIPFEVNLQKTIE